MPSGLPPYAQALLDPLAYPERPASVELQQTQMSFIFLTGSHAYKTKKPVNLGYLDYTTLEKRGYFCRQELELNRRLSPGAYIGVLPVTQSPAGIQLGGDGEVIEYAVKMKQLPRDRMMDVLLPQNLVTPAMLETVAALMADFHSRAATGPQISAFGSLEGIRTNNDENFSQTEKYIGSLITQRSHSLIREYTGGFIYGNADLFKRRVDQGRIRDCHGDLHCAHVCFASDIYIYDCIEFNDRFRYCDTASEIAFLAMDMDRYGRADLSASFVQSYIRAGGDKEITALLDFYKCYRACVRGKVACFKYDDPLLRDKDAIAREAGLYFDLAHKYACRKPVVIIVTGLIGTGKTTAARKIGQGLGYAVLSSDVIRKELAGVPAGEQHYDDFSSGLYSPAFTEKTYAELFSRAQGLLNKGQSVIMDASFKKRSDRAAALKLAAGSGANFLAVECVADEATIKGRLERRKQAGSVSDGRWEIFADIKKDFEKVDEISGPGHIIFDTTDQSVNIIALLLQRIAGL